MQENVKAKIHRAMKTICLFHNATLFFSPQGSQDGPVVKWLRDLRGRNKVQGAGVDDVDEDMGTDNTKRPRRRSPPLAGPRNTVGGVHLEGARAPHWVFSLRAARGLPVVAQYSQMPLSQEREIQSSVLSRFAAGVTLPAGRLMLTFLVLVCCNLVGQSCSHACADSLVGGAVTSMAMRNIPVGWRSLRGSTVGFRVWLLLVDTSAAWSRTLSTKWGQWDDACSACFAACAENKCQRVQGLHGLLVEIVGLGVRLGVLLVCGA